MSTTVESRLKVEMGRGWSGGEGGRNGGGEKGWETCGGNQSNELQLLIVAHSLKLERVESHGFISNLAMKSFLDNCEYLYLTYTFMRYFYFHLISNQQCSNFSYVTKFSD